MSYIKYDVDINPATYSEMEGLRQSYKGEHMNHEQALDLLNAMGLPSESPKLWKLCLKYQVLIQKGSRRYAYYMVPIDPYAMSTLKKLENDFYNGKVPKGNKNIEPKRIVKDEITGMTKLSPEFCANYLMRRGYVVFKLSPNLIKLKRMFTLQFLMESMEAEMVLPVGQDPDIK